jgi:plastocyanin
MYLGAGLVLALVMITCTDDRVAGPQHPGRLSLDARSLVLTAPGQPLLPLDSIRITLRRPTESAFAYDQTFPLRADTLAADSLVLRLDVELQQNTEDFVLDVTVKGGGAAWYTATGNVQITAGAVAQPPALLARYVGPGANAKRVQVLPADTTVLGGTTFLVHAVVYDSSDGPIAGAPVGYRLSDSTRGALLPTLLAATYTAPVALRDSVWVVAETPTHLRDSTRIHVTPPAALLQKVSGDLQSGVIGGALLQPLVVRVRDALGAPFKGATVTWSVTAGTATLTPPGPVTTDDSGLAAVTVTPLSLGVLTIQAGAAGLSGSPVSFGASVLSGTIHQVIISPKVDTIARGTGLQYTATLQDSLGNTVSGTVSWSSTVPAIASVNSTGLASGVAGDSTLIIAAAGGHADTARLYVRALRSVTVTPADTVITAISDSFQLTATAHDNFGGVVAGGFTTRFISASPTVVSVGAATGRVKAVGAGNGVLIVRDSVDPQLVVQGTATVHVNQRAFSIVNNPKDSIQVGVSGRGQIVATALDRNGFPIPGRTFGWVTRDPAVASIDQSGVVTGLQLGASTYAVDTLVDSATVLRDSTRVSVVAAPPPLLQWGFDTLAIGNGGNVSVGLSLNRTAAAPVVIRVISKDTLKVKPSQPLVTIPAGQAGASIVLNGLAATLAADTVIAQDTAGFYAPDTLFVIVVSTIQFQEVGQFFRQTNFYVNQNETHKATVWLSDPAPAGGLGVTFVYGKAGTSAVSPAPAIIAAGQLSADVVIQGLAPGTDSVVPTSGGFAGKFSYVAVAPDSLRVAVPYPYVAGVGQTITPYVTYAYSMDHPLVVSLGITPAIGTLPGTVIVPTGGNYSYFTVAGTGPGIATVTASAPGWISDTGTIQFTTPQLGAGGSTSLVAGDPTRGSWSAYTGDSITPYSHPVVDTVRVTAVSRNDSVVVVDSALGKVLPGQTGVSVYNALYAPPGAGGRSTWVVMTAPGYRPDSILVTVQAPALTFAASYPYQVGVGTRWQNAGYVQIPYARPDSFTVFFQHTRRGIVSGPDSVTIPKGQTYVYFDITGDSLGLDSISVTGLTGYTVPAPQAITVVPLHVSIYTQPSTLYTISRPQPVGVYVHQEPYPYYANPLVAPLRVSLSSSDTAAFKLDSSGVTIPVGAYVSNYDTLRVPAGAVGNDSGRVLISAAGSTNDSSAVIRVLPTPLTLNVPYPQQVAYGLKLQNGSVYIPDAAPDTVRIGLTHLLPGDSVTPDTVRILRGASSSGYFDIVARDSTGTDSVTAAAPGYVSSRVAVGLVPAQVDVQDIGSNHLTTEPPYRVTTVARMRPYPAYSQYAVDTVRFTIATTNATVLQIDSAASVTPAADSGVAYVAPGSYYGTFRLRFVGSGTAQIVVSAPGFGTDTMAPVTVSGPTLHLAYPTLTLGVGQVFPNQYVYVDNAVSQPLVVKLTRSDSTLPPSTQAFLLSADSVVIPVGQSYSPSFSLTGQTVASAQLIARAAGYAESRATVSVGQPQLVAPATLSLAVGEAPRNVTVYTADQNGTARSVAAALAVRDSSTDSTVARADSSLVTIPASQYYATFPIRGKAKGTVSVVFTAPGYTPDTMVVSVDTAQLQLLSPPNGLGAGQVAVGQMYVQLPYYTDSALVVSLASTNTGVLTVPASVIIPAGNYYASFDVTGIGPGLANVTATAAQAKPVSVPVRISTPNLQVSLSGATNAGQKSTLSVTARDSLGTARRPASPLVVTLVSSVPGHTTFDSSTITIPTTGTTASTGVVFDTAGSYTITVNAAGYNAGNATTTTTGALVAMGDNFFTPGTVTIQAGQTVLWRNGGSVQHTTSSTTAVWNSGPLNAGQTYIRTFSTPGTFPYQCNIHGAAMSGTVIVQ